MSEADSMGTVPATDAAATDAVIDAIADIEAKRRETEKEAGLAMSCSSSLHRLQELHDHEKEALRLRGPGSGHQENVQAVSAEMERVRKLAPVTNQRPGGRNIYEDRRGPSWRNAARTVRNKGRRTMGRGGR